PNVSNIIRTGPAIAKNTPRSSKDRPGNRPVVLFRSFMVTFLQVKHLANFSTTLVGSAQDFDVQIPELLGDCDRLFLGASFHDCETADEFLRLGKGTVGHDNVSA